MGLRTVDLAYGPLKKTWHPDAAKTGLIDEAGFDRWKGHDMAPKAFDNEEQAIDRLSGTSSVV